MSVTRLDFFAVTILPGQGTVEREDFIQEAFSG